MNQSGVEADKQDDKKAYGYVDGGKGEGDYSAQQRAWDASMNAMDGPNCLNFTLWTYVPDNSHQWGDLWYGAASSSLCGLLTLRNGEDLSLYSQDDAKKTELWVDKTKGSSASLSTSSTTLAGPRFSPKGIESGDGVTPGLILEGSRAVEAYVRPYPTATVGTPERIDFDIASTTFNLSVKVSSQDEVSEDVTTEVYLPFVHYASSLEPYVSRGSNSNSNSNSRTSLLASRSSTPTPSELKTTGSQSLRLGVDVKMSHGTYEIVGQTLYWKYPVPSSGEETYTIEVKRSGGAIKRDLGYVQTGGWGEVCPSCVIA
jgi:hypothetical protein